ncbi:6-carboxyhexanoate--CoA ligase [Thermovibrio ammonificans]
MALFSVKMRSSKGGVHISGAERIVKEEEVEQTVLELLRRAKHHSRGEADFINVKVEKLKKEPLKLKALPVFEVRSRLPVEKVLRRLSYPLIPEELVVKTYKLLLKGPAPNGSVMRGAAVIEVPEGRRLEEDRFKGVRASMLDGTEELRRELQRLAGDKFTENFAEALVLSTKVLHHPDVLGELCISDDPDYTTGYISLKGKGYFRVEGIKPKGLKKGGRAIFVKKGCSFKKLAEYLKEEPVIVTEASGYFSLEL